MHMQGGSSPRSETGRSSGRAPRSGRRSARRWSWGPPARPPAARGGRPAGWGAAVAGAGGAVGAAPRSSAPAAAPVSRSAPRPSLGMRGAWHCQASAGERTWAAVTARSVTRAQTFAGAIFACLQGRRNTHKCGAAVRRAPVRPGGAKKGATFLEAAGAPERACGGVPQRCMHMQDTAAPAGTPLPPPPLPPPAAASAPVDKTTLGGTVAAASTSHCTGTLATQSTVCCQRMQQSAGGSSLLCTGLLGGRPRLPAQLLTPTASGSCPATAPGPWAPPAASRWWPARSAAAGARLRACAALPRPPEPSPPCFRARWWAPQRMRLQGGAKAKTYAVGERALNARAQASCAQPPEQLQACKPSLLPPPPQPTCGGALLRGHAHAARRAAAAGPAAGACGARGAARAGLVALAPRLHAALLRLHRKVTHLRSRGGWGWGKQQASAA